MRNDDRFGSLAPLSGMRMQQSADYTPQQNETARYIGDMLSQLEWMAHRHDLPLVATMLANARQHASEDMAAEAGMAVNEDHHEAANPPNAD